MGVIEISTPNSNNVMGVSGLNGNFEVNSIEEIGSPRSANINPALVGIKGKDFKYSDFTPEQLEALKVKGDPFLFSDFTPQQLEDLKIKGDPFLFSDFTPEQILQLQGAPGKDGLKGLEIEIIDGELIIQDKPETEIDLIDGELIIN